MTSLEKTTAAASVVLFGALGYGIYRATDAGFFAAVSVTSPDALKWPYSDICVPWANGVPSTVHWFEMPATITPGTRVSLRMAPCSADAGLGADYVMVQFGLVPVDGGVLGEFAELRKRLIANGVIPTEDRSFVKRIASPVNVNCHVAIFRETDNSAPSDLCACGAGCWENQTSKTGIFKPGIKNMTFRPGKWKYPDGGVTAARLCIPKVCVELAGSNSMPKECE